MLITKKSRLTGKIHTMEIPITQEQLDSINRKDNLIQRIIPDVKPELREFLISGITPEEWNNEFKDV